MGKMYKGKSRDEMKIDRGPFCTKHQTQLRPKRKTAEIESEANGQKATKTRGESAMVRLQTLTDGGMWRAFKFKLIVKLGGYKNN